MVVLTERASPSIRTAIGWLYPLEHYDRILSLDLLCQYVELLLLMGSNRNAERDSVRTILLGARNRLTDLEYDRLRDYVDLLTVGRMGVSSRIP